MPTTNEFLMDLFANIVGNKLTDADKEQMLRAILELLLEVRERLDNIERKIERLKHE